VVVRDVSPGLVTGGWPGALDPEWRSRGRSRPVHDASQGS